MEFHPQRLTHKNILSSLAAMLFGALILQYVLHIPLVGEAWLGLVVGAFATNLIRIFLTPEQYCWVINNLHWNDYRTDDTWGT